MLGIMNNMEMIVGWSDLNPPYQILTVEMNTRDNYILFELYGKAIAKFLGVLRMPLNVDYTMEQFAIEVKIY